VKDITFIELAKITGKNLVVCVSNLTKERSEFFSVDTMPQLSIVTAIRVSCCIPILFTPISINDDVFMDGGLYDNFPIDYFKNSTLKDILGINVIYKNYQRTDTFFNYMMFILSSLLDKVNTKSMNDTSKNIVTLDFEEDDWFSITELCVKFPKERWSTYVQYGYNRIKQQLGHES
jgi:predicted acylesterase/phospholipase RssA